MVYFAQFLSLSLYQLSQLHYCFSNQQLHAKNGYPLWVFVVMISIGIIIWISGMMLQIFVDTLPAKCGYTNEFSFFYRYRQRAILFDGDSWTDDWLLQIWFLWNFTVAVISQLWDLVILLFYLFKMTKIGKIHKSKDDGVWDNVLSILHRIVIITVFYQICSLCATFLFTSLSLLQKYENTNSMVYELRTGGLIVCCNVLWSFSVYLMMDHNTTIYVVFLRFLRRFGLKYCCFCCCAKIVDQQIARWEISKDMDALNDMITRQGQSDANVEITSQTIPNVSVNVRYTSDVVSKEMKDMSPSTLTSVRV